MSYRIRCYTLFDVTQTGVLNRSRPNEGDITDWIHRRNTQCNFDTIIQVISLRSQPELIKNTVKVPITDKEMFGFAYEFKEDTSYCWTFDFEIHHASVFENGIEPFGALYKDCEGVPMILTNTQTETVPALLNISPELRNIYFEEL